MLELKDVGLRAGTFQLERIKLSIPAGGYGVLMGPTGCGKTTLLEAVCGLRTVDRGRIRVGDRDVTHQIPASRGIGYVPQDAALFPRMTVRDQIGLGLKVRGLRRAAIDDRVQHLAEALAITHLLDRRPDRSTALSGGERQRVALARALAYSPKLLCLDEPLSALDEDTHGQIMQLLEALWREHGFTALHVTHARQEAQRLATHLFRFDAGNIVPVDPPRA